MSFFTAIAAWLSINKVVASVSIGMAGLALRFLQLRKPPPDPHLRLQSLGRGIAFEAPVGLPFTLRDLQGEQIHNVYAITLRFWNAGRRELRPVGNRTEDVPDFTIDFSDGARILGGHSICSTAGMRFEPVIAGPQGGDLADHAERARGMDRSLCVWKAPPERRGWLPLSEGTRRKARYGAC